MVWASTQQPPAPELWHSGRAESQRQNDNHGNHPQQRPAVCSEAATAATAQHGITAELPTPAASSKIPPSPSSSSLLHQVSFTRRRCLFGLNTTNMMTRCFHPVLPLMVQQNAIHNAAWRSVAQHGVAQHSTAQFKSNLAPYKWLCMVDMT